MSELNSPPANPGHPKMQNRRLSKIQDTAVDDLHDITTHALDGNSPPPHHESSVMSYMESHSPNDESAHKCIPRSPLLSRSNSVWDDEEEMVSEVEKTEERAPRGRGAADLVMMPPEQPPKSSSGGLGREEARIPEGAVDVRKETRREDRRS